MKIRTFEGCFVALVALTAWSCADHNPHASPTTSSSSGGGASSSGGTSSGDDGTNPGDDGGSDGAPVQSRTATLDDVSFANVDRHGSTLVLTIDGTDTAGLTTEANVQAVDSSNNPVIAFDTNWDGVADSSQKRFHFDTSTLGQTSFTATITIPFVYGDAPTIASAVVSLVDANGAVTQPLTASLAVQPVANLGDPCDPAGVTSRCADALSCSTSTSTCTASVAPTITQVAYYNGATPAQLFLGSDPDQNLASLTITYLDRNGAPLSVDTSGDDSGAPTSGFTVAAQRTNERSFFVENYPTSGFPSLVPQISVVANDVGGGTSAAVTALITPRPVKGVGAQCDAYGFVSCGVGTACSPGTAGVASTCVATTSLLKTACAGAAPISQTGILGAWGQAAGPSLFDPPAGCSVPTAINRPESLLSMTLTNDVSTVTLSTATPETDFDTILYVLPSCTPLPADQTDVGAVDAGTKDAGSGTSLGCNDDVDGQGYASTLTLTNVPAGNYIVVVDSVGYQGGHYGLTISVQ